MFARTALTTFALAVLAGVPASQAQDGAAPSTAVRTVDTMNKLWGRHPGLRANHAQGVVVEGSFTPTPEAAGLSSAAILAGKPVPVTVRFSDATGYRTSCGSCWDKVGLHGGVYRCTRCPDAVPVPT